MISGGGDDDTETNVYVSNLNLSKMFVSIKTWKNNECSVWYLNVLTY